LFFYIPLNKGFDLNFTFYIHLNVILFFAFGSSQICLPLFWFLPLVIVSLKHVPLNIYTPMCLLKQSFLKIICIHDKHFIVLRYTTLFVHLFVIVLTFTELNCYSHCSRVAFLELFSQICFKEVLSFKTFYDMQFSILISVS